MRSCGKVVAIVNDRLVLVEVTQPDKFEPRALFRVFEERSIPSAKAESIGVNMIQLSKGELEFESFQGDDRKYAMLAVRRATRTETVRRPGPFEIASGLSGILGAREEQVERVVGASATLDKQQSLGIEVGPVQVGDYVSPT